MLNRFILRSALIPAAFALPCLAAQTDSTITTGNPAQYTVYSFSAESSGKNSDGTGPSGRIVVGADGSYYGTTLQGGANGGGALFKIAANGTFVNLHSFGIGADGSMPSGSLMMASDGNLYGTTVSGGANSNGTIFQLTPAGGYTVLHSFAAANSNGGNTDGTYAWGSLAQGTDGNLYGTARFGGANGYGTVFRISTAGSFSLLYTFTGTTDGEAPFQGLAVGADGNFYGTTDVTAFKVTSAGALTTLHTFALTDGLAETSLVRGTDNNFYGITNGAPNKPGTSGIFFQLKPDGTYTALSTLDAPTYAIFNDQEQKVGPNVDGLNISYTLTLGPDGNFYGAGMGGGAMAYGDVFKVTPNGVFTNVYSFNNRKDSKLKLHAYAPDSSISVDASGNLIGAGQIGGANNTGAVFKIAKASVLTASLTVTPATLSAGQTATFSWTSTGASSCAFIGTAIKAGILPASGSVTHKGPAAGKKMVTGIQCKDKIGGQANSTVTVSTN